MSSSENKISNRKIVFIVLFLFLFICCGIVGVAAQLSVSSLTICAKIGSPCVVSADCCNNASCIESVCVKRVVTTTVVESTTQAQSSTILQNTTTISTVATTTQVTRSFSMRPFSSQDVVIRVPRNALFMLFSNRSCSAKTVFKFTGSGNTCSSNTADCQYEDLQDVNSPVANVIFSNFTAATLHSYDPRYEGVWAACRLDATRQVYVELIPEDRKPINASNSEYHKYVLGPNGFARRKRDVDQGTRAQAFITDIEMHCINATSYEDCVSALVYKYVRSYFDFNITSVLKLYVNKTQQLLSDAHEHTWLDLRPLYVVGFLIGYLYAHHFFSLIYRVFVICVKVLRWVRSLCRRGRREQQWFIQMHKTMDKTNVSNQQEAKAVAPKTPVTTGESLAGNNTTMDDTQNDTKQYASLDVGADESETLGGAEESISAARDMFMATKPANIVHPPQRTAPHVPLQQPDYESQFFFDTFKVTSTDVAGTFTYYQLPSALDNYAQMKKVLQKFLYCQFDIVFTLVPPDNTSISGIVLAAWKPGQNMAAGKSTITSNCLAYAEQLTHAELHLNSSQPVKLRVNYCGPTMYYSDNTKFVTPKSTRAIPDWGTLIVMLKAPMRSGGASSTTVRIMCNLVNVRIYMDRMMDNSQFFPTRRIERQVIRQGPVRSTNGRTCYVKITSLKPDEVEILNFSTNNITIGKMQDSTLPIEMKGDDVNATMGGVGFDKPTDTTNVDALRVTSYQNLNHFSGVRQAVRMSGVGYDSSMIRGYDMNDVDEMSFEFYKNMYSYITTINIGTDSVEGKLLRSFPISPIQSGKGPTNIPEIFARLARFWSGSLKFKVDVNSTLLQTSKIFIGVYYGIDTTQLPSLYEAGKPDPLSVPGMTIDLKSGHNTYEFEIAFVHYNKQQTTIKNLSASKPTVKNGAIGTIGVYLMNALNAPTGQPTQADLVVSVAMGSSFSLYNFAPSDTFVTTQSLKFNVGKDVMPFDPYIDHLVSLKQYWLIPRFVAKLNFLQQSTVLHIAYSDLITYFPLLNMYAGSKGSIQYIFRFTNIPSTATVICRAMFNVPVKATTDDTDAVGYGSVNAGYVSGKWSGSNNGFIELGNSSKAGVLGPNNGINFFDEQAGYQISLCGWTAKYERWMNAALEREIIMEAPMPTEFAYNAHDLLKNRITFNFTISDVKSPIYKDMSQVSATLYVAVGDDFRAVMFSSGIVGSKVSNIARSQGTTHWDFDNEGDAQ